jgi:hypothetical protein
MSIIYLETNADPREMMNETINIKIDESGGVIGGKVSSIAKIELAISTKRNPIVSSKTIIISFDP